MNALRLIVVIRTPDRFNEYNYYSSVRDSRLSYMPTVSYYDIRDRRVYEEEESSLARRKRSTIVKMQSSTDTFNGNESKYVTEYVSMQIPTYSYVVTVRLST